MYLHVVKCKYRVSIRPILFQLKSIKFYLYGIYYNTSRLQMLHGSLEHGNLNSGKKKLWVVHMSGNTLSFLHGSWFCRTDSTRPRSSLLFLRSLPVHIHSQTKFSLEMGLGSVPSIAFPAVQVNKPVATEPSGN